MKIKQIEKDGSVEWSLFGRLDEGAEGALNTLLPQIRGAQLAVDCSGIESVNSIGISCWIQFLKFIPDSIQVEFSKCPQVMMDAAVIVSGFFGGGKVTSFFFSKKCGSCNTYTRTLFQASHVKGDAEQTRIACKKCKTSIVLGDDFAALLTIL